MEKRLYIEKKRPVNKKSKFKGIVILICILLFFEIFISTDWYKMNGQFTGSSNGTQLNTNTMDEQLVKSISGKIVRFHVIANSDDAMDQALKIKVKDAILEYISPLLGNVNTKAEAYQILNDNDSRIKEIAKAVIDSNGFSYAVTTTSGREMFPIKAYGNIVLPAGEYDAYRVIIGDGLGQNWWCVMFPPVCFIDITKYDKNIKKSEEMMAKILTKDEYSAILNNIDPNEIEFRFKVIEMLSEMLSPNKILLKS